MPILEFVCKDCDHRFEKIVHGSATPQCPSCAGQQLERQLSVFAVGGKQPAFAMQDAMGACGSCGDPRGPGACAMN